MRKYANFDSPDGLWDDLIAWGRANGVGFVKIRLSNYHDGKPTIVKIGCDRGGACPLRAKVRQSTTSKMNCGFKATAKRVGNGRLGTGPWVFAVDPGMGLHNHPPSPLTAAALSTYWCYRGLTDDMRDTVQEMTLIRQPSLELYTSS